MTSARRSGAYCGGLILATTYTDDTLLDIVKAYRVSLRQKNVPSHQCQLSALLSTPESASRGTPARPTSRLPSLNTSTMQRLNRPSPPRHRYKTETASSRKRDGRRPAPRSGPSTTAVSHGRHRLRGIVRILTEHWLSDYKSELVPLESHRRLSSSSAGFGLRARVEPPIARRYAGPPSPQS